MGAYLLGDKVSGLARQSTPALECTGGIWILAALKIALFFIFELTMVEKALMEG